MDKAQLDRTVEALESENRYAEADLVIDLNRSVAEMIEVLKEIVGQEKPNKYGYDAAEVALKDEWRDKARAVLKTAQNGGLTPTEMWYVFGIKDTYYATKMTAEAAARQAFPDEDPDKRYSRVYYKTMYYEEV